MKVTARNQDPEYVTTLLQSREESSAKVLVKSLGPAQMVNVLSMEFGEVGHHGQIVTVTARSQEPEVVTSLFQQMEESLVQDLAKILNHVLEVNVLWMVYGVLGSNGQLV